MWNNHQQLITFVTISPSRVSQVGMVPPQDEGICALSYAILSLPVIGMDPTRHHRENGQPRMCAKV